MLDVGSVVLFLIGVVLVAARLPNASIIMIGSAVIAGYVLADFVSGFVHFLGDTVGSETTPILSEFIQPFREHHVDQTAITRHDFFVTNGHNCLVSLPFLAVMAFVVPDTLLSNQLFAWIYFAFFFLILSVFATNQIHKWSHQDQPVKIVQLLQRTGLILTPARHRLHHTAPFDSHFCITTAWLNSPLERVGFFRRLARLLRPFTV